MMKSKETSNSFLLPPLGLVGGAALADPGRGGSPFIDPRFEPLEPAEAVVEASETAD